MKIESHRRNTSRLRILYVLFGFFFLVLAAGLFHRQIVQGRTFRDQERRQNLRRIVMPGPRGNISDRQGRLLVGNRPLYNAVVYLNELRPAFRREYIGLVRAAREAGHRRNSHALQIEARRRVVQYQLNRLNRLLDRHEEIGARIIERHFSESLLLPLPLIKDLPEAEFARLVEQLPVDDPIQLLSDSTRYYPNGSHAAQVLGFATPGEEEGDPGLPGGDMATFRFKSRIGQSGIERRYDELLQGQAGGEIWVVDPSGFQYKCTARRQPVKGHDLRLSLDLKLQITAENALGGLTGAVIALDLPSGQVLAMASKPDYDLARLSPSLTHEYNAEIAARGAWLNRATQGLYPPGSSFKIVTAMAALRAGLAGPIDREECTGFTQVGSRKFYCHNRAGHGWENLETALRDSCNVFFYRLGLAIGPAPIAAEARLFGLDRPTGIQLPAEARAMIVPDPAWKKRRYGQEWFAGDSANLAIGQGYLRVTPMQMACLTGALALRTLPIVPILVPDDPPPGADRRQPLSLPEQDWRRLIDGMEQAADTGTARLVSVRGLRIAAKTGTAQVWSNGVELTIAWFIGFAPIEDPRLAVCVMVEGADPNDNYHGGTTSAPIAREIFLDCFPPPANDP